MTNQSPFARMRRLHARGRRSRGLVVDRDGVALGPDAVLVSHSAAGYRCARTDDLVRLTHLVFAGDARLRRLPTVLARIARALDAGDLVKAQLLGLEISIGELDDSQLARLAGAADLIKASFDPSQPRDEGGRWTGEGGGDGVAADAAGISPVQIADASESISDAGGILPRQSPANIAGNETSKPAATATATPPAPPGTGNVREYSPEEAAKLPPPPAGSKYVTLNDGSVVWSAYSNHEKGGPMLMPKDVSLAENVKAGQKIRDTYYTESLADPDEAWSNSTIAMKRLFAPSHGTMDYQSVYGSSIDYDKDYVDFTSYNYGVVAAAAGYSKTMALVYSGGANVGANVADRLRGSSDSSRDTHGPFLNKVRNAEMIEKGYDDYKTGRIVALAK